MTHLIGSEEILPQREEKHICTPKYHRERKSLPHSHSPTEFSQLPGGYVYWLLLLLMNERERSHKKMQGGRGASQVTQGRDCMSDYAWRLVNRAPEAHLISTQPSSHRHSLRAEEAAAK